MDNDSNPSNSSEQEILDVCVLLSINCCGESYVWEQRNIPPGAVVSSSSRDIVNK